MKTIISHSSYFNVESTVKLGDYIEAKVMVNVGINSNDYKDAEIISEEIIEIKYKGIKVDDINKFDNDLLNKGIELQSQLSKLAENTITVDFVEELIQQSSHRR